MALPATGKVNFVGTFNSNAQLNYILCIILQLLSIFYTRQGAYAHVWQIVNELPTMPANINVAFCAQIVLMDLLHKTVNICFTL